MLLMMLLIVHAVNIVPELQKSLHEYSLVIAASHKDSHGDFHASYASHSRDDSHSKYIIQYGDCLYDYHTASHDASSTCSQYLQYPHGTIPYMWL